MKPDNPSESSPVDAHYSWTRVLHDLKNPAGVVFGYADMLRRPHIANNPEKVLQYAEKIHFSSKLLLRLLQDLCDAQLSHDHINAVKISNVQTIRLFQSILEPYALRALQKGLYFKVELAQAMPSHLAVDAMRMGQILSNLIDNGIKYTNEGGLTVTLDYQPKDQDQGTLKVLIADTGCGFSPDLKDKIFEPFFRVKSSAQTSEGQGIGLASARMIAHQLGGTLTMVYSEIGKGCEFILKIPTRCLDISDEIHALNLNVSATDLLDRPLSPRPVESHQGQ